MTKERMDSLNSPLNLNQLQIILSEFENKYWDAPKDEVGKTRHINLHLSKLMGKIGEVTERREHSLDRDTTILKEEVIPDLLYFALSLAEIHDVNLQEAFFERLEQNKIRVKAWKEQEQDQ